MVFWGSTLSWLLLIIVILADFLFTYLFSLFYPGYSNKTQVISLLGNPKSPVATIFNIWLTAAGLLFCISAVNFFIVYYSTSILLATIGSIALLCFGIGTGIVGGIFSIDENKEFKTLPSVIHGIGVGIGFTALMAIPIIVSLISFKIGDSVIAIESIMFFILSFLFSMLYILSEKNIFKNPIVGFNGLWQRLLLVCMYMPLLLIAINIL